jgi:arylsulfatase A-like enzyme
MTSAESMGGRPNIVLILTDNQQAATLGCYGNSEIRTPNLDRLSAEGVTFDRAYCPNGLCSPSRATVLTGLMPSQHGVHTWIDDRRSSEWPAGWHALDGLSTLPGLLRNAGYATALVGKYHLGQPTDPMAGFDHWVTMEDGHVKSFWNNRIFDNGRVYDQPGHSVDFFTAKAVEWIEAQAGGDQRFFLYLPYPAPYGHWPATQEPIETRHHATYADCPMHTVPRCGLSPETVRQYDLIKANSGKGLDYSMLLRTPNDLPTLRNYYAQISMVDDGVGAIMAALDRLDLAEDTLVVFTTDHGFSLGHHGFWGHGSATYPSNLHHAAHSIPLIARQRGVTAAGRRSDAVVQNGDLFATLLERADVAMPVGMANPSRSLAGELAGAGQPALDAVFAEQEETRVIRTRDWVLFHRFDGAEPLGDALYHTAEDPDETRNLSGNPEVAEIEAALCARLAAFFARHSRPEADLWSGGHPIQNSTRQALWKAAWGADWAPVFAYDRSRG